MVRLLWPNGRGVVPAASIPTAQQIEAFEAKAFDEPCGRRRDADRGILTILSLRWIFGVGEGKDRGGRLIARD
jgi:hypothetical protein